MTRSKRSLGVFLAALTTWGVAACSNSPDAPQTGRLQVSLVDAPSPLEGIEAVTLVLNAVRVHPSAAAGDSDTGWIDVLPDTLSVQDRTFDLLQLTNGVEAVLGEVTLAVGKYTQIRLVVSSATVRVNGVDYDLSIPSSATSGLKLIHPFTIRSDQTTHLVLDFDASRSIQAIPPGSTNFELDPTIRVEEMEQAGSISGTVLPTGIDALVVAVSAASGDTLASTHPDATSGGYMLVALAPGMVHVLASAPGYEAASDSNVAVTAGGITSGIDFTLQPTP